MASVLVRAKIFNQPLHDNKIFIKGLMSKKVYERIFISDNKLKQ